MTNLKIAVSQFPVSDDIRKNEPYIIRHIIYAHNKGADVIHFPEMSLSGYDTEISQLNYQLLDKSLDRICNLAKQYKINVILGAHQKSDSATRPYNSTYVISKIDQIIGTYSKAKLYKDENKRFSAGDSFFITEMNGVKCGFLICYDSCFPELFDYYRKNGVKVLFLSYYNANSSHGKNSMNCLVEAQLITRATDNMMYISGSNSSAKYSRMPSGVVSPDGKLVKLKRHKTGILIYDCLNESLGWTYNNK